MTDVSRSVSISKKFSSVNDGTTKHIYDGVFSSAQPLKPRFNGSSSALPSRIEDYAEIFACSLSSASAFASQGSSIPILDLPAVDRSRVGISGGDYSGVFATSGGADRIGLSYEELLRESNKKPGREFQLPRVPEHTSAVPSRSQEFPVNSGGHRSSKVRWKQSSRSQEFPLNSRKNQAPTNFGNNVTSNVPGSVPSRSQEFPPNMGNDQMLMSKQYVQRSTSLATGPSNREEYQRSTSLATGASNREESQRSTNLATGPSNREESQRSTNLATGPSNREESQRSTNLATGPSNREESQRSTNLATGPSNRQESQRSTNLATGPSNRQESPPNLVNNQKPPSTENGHISTSAVKRSAKSREFPLSTVNSHQMARGIENDQTSTTQTTYSSKSQEFPPSAGNIQMPTSTNNGQTSTGPGIHSFKSQESPRSTVDNQIPAGRDSGPILKSREFPVNVANNQKTASVTPDQAFDSAKHFNVSYNKINHLNTDDMTHVAELNAVSGYTCLFNEAPSKKTNDETTSSNDADVSMDVNKKKKRGKHTRATSDLSTSNQVSEHASGLRRGFSGPLEGPTLSSLQSFGSSGSLKRLTSQKSKGTHSKRRPGFDGDSTPPLLEEQLDKNSEAAISAEAVKRAIQEAEVQIRLAKEILKGNIKMSFKDTLNGGDTSVNGSNEAYGLWRKKQVKTRSDNRYADVVKGSPRDYVEHTVPKDRKIGNAADRLAEKMQEDYVRSDDAIEKAVSSGSPISPAAAEEVSWYTEQRDPRNQTVEMEVANGKFVQAEPNPAQESTRQESGGGEWDAAKHLSQLFSGVKNRLVSFMSKQPETGRKVQQMDLPNASRFSDQSIENTPYMMKDMDAYKSKIDREHISEMEVQVSQPVATCHEAMEREDLHHGGAGLNMQESEASRMKSDFDTEQDIVAEGVTQSPDAAKLNDEPARLNDETARLNDETAKLNDEPAKLNDEPAKLNDEPSAHSEPEPEVKEIEVRGLGVNELHETLSYTEAVKHNDMGGDPPEPVSELERSSIQEHQMNDEKEEHIQGEVQDLNSVDSAWLGHENSQMDTVRIEEHGKRLEAACSFDDGELTSWDSSDESAEEIEAEKLSEEKADDSFHSIDERSGLEAAVDVEECKLEERETDAEDDKICKVEGDFASKDDEVCGEEVREIAAVDDEACNWEEREIARENDEACIGEERGIAGEDDEVCEGDEIEIVAEDDEAWEGKESEIVAEDDKVCEGKESEIVAEDDEACEGEESEISVKHDEEYKTREGVVAHDLQHKEDVETLEHSDDSEVLSKEAKYDDDECAWEENEKNKGKGSTSEAVASPAEVFNDSSNYNEHIAATEGVSKLAEFSFFSRKKETSEQVVPSSEETRDAEVSCGEAEAMMELNSTHVEATSEEHEVSSLQTDDESVGEDMMTASVLAEPAIETEKTNQEIIHDSGATLVNFHVWPCEIEQNASVQKHDNVKAKRLTTDDSFENQGYGVEGEDANTGAANQCDESMGETGGKDNVIEDESVADIGLAGADSDNKECDMDMDEEEGKNGMVEDVSETDTGVADIEKNRHDVAVSKEEGKHNLEASPHRRRRWFQNREAEPKQPSILVEEVIFAETDQEHTKGSEFHDCVEVHVDNTVDRSEESGAVLAEESKSTSAEATHRRRRWFDNSQETGVPQKPILFEGNATTSEGTDEVIADESKTKETNADSERKEATDVNESNVLNAEGETKVDMKASHRRRRWFENEEKVGLGQRATILEVNEATVEVEDETTARDNSAKSKQSTETSSLPDTYGKVDSEARPQRDVRETPTRDREKEKERIAVERVIREARERAFADARERAERAAAEKANTGGRVKAAAAHARQGGNSSASSAEAVNKAIYEKASAEAKLRAERAAVERATSEARERALQKAMSEKAANKDQKSQNSSPPGSSKTSASEKSSGNINESPQRRKARLERNKRTMERAAKALEEKNMRDVLALREQAERNKFADALDMEVKRWCSGKEGNLRALLSTLQYVLGPDSGWQPTSLTELVSTTAVRKAYKRAALCVHPDKLQQRGATIPQKYICEKVFDLLKEAWHKFNPDDR